MDIKEINTNEFLIGYDMGIGFECSLDTEANYCPFLL